MEAIGQGGTVTQLIKAPPSSNAMQLMRATGAELVLVRREAQAVVPQVRWALTSSASRMRTRSGKRVSSVLRRLAPQRWDWSSAQLSGPGEPIPHEWELYLPSVSGETWCSM